MGYLIAKKYPTKLFLRAADHTYVECGTGHKAWGCWGGKTGGRKFNSGLGSTLRAESIAEPNERAAVTCYLINGVCHQAANRILFPAEIVVSGARGYTLSVSLFGVYGRGGKGKCSTATPFKDYPHITGDLSECTDKGPEQLYSTKMKSTYERHPRLTAHLRNIKHLYNRLTDIKSFNETNKNIYVEMFHQEILYKFYSKISQIKIDGLLEQKKHIEAKHTSLIDSLTNKEISAANFVSEFNIMTDNFQLESANILSEKQFEQMFNYNPYHPIVLADPYAVDIAFGEGTSEKVYPNLPG